MIERVHDKKELMRRLGDIITLIPRKAQQTARI